LVLSCHITGVFDVNRNTTLQNDDFSLVEKWASSVAAKQLHGVMFHNNLSEATCRAFSGEHLTLIKIADQQLYNPNVYRYFVYQRFLDEYAHAIKALFVTDVTDVELLRDPFTAALFQENPASLFCGDEPTTLDNAWMKAHGQHFRAQIPDYAAYEAAFGPAPLLNCGIIGGQITVMRDFIAQLCAIHAQYNQHNKTAYTGDMGAFNYVARTKFNHNLLHGAPINTVFKACEENNTACWFKHK